MDTATLAIAVFRPPVHDRLILVAQMHTEVAL
jgi:hypothetical protein